MSEIIPTHYRRQNDISDDGRNPEFVIGLAVYLDRAVDGPNGPQGSITLEMGPLDGLGEKKALNHHPSNVEMYAALHQALTTLMGDDEVKNYVESLARLVKQEQVNKKFEAMAGTTPMQRVLHNAKRADTQAQRDAERLLKRLS